MLKVSTILLACSCFMLAASVFVAAIALVFHPSKSEAAKILEELKPQIQCALCKAGLEKNGCEATCMPRSENNYANTEDCKLTEKRKEYLSAIIDKKIKSGPSYQAHMDTLKSAMNMEDSNSVLNRIQILNLNVPRPSAHWYLDEKSERPAFANKRDNPDMRNVSWIWETGNEIAHSQNGIQHVDGHMNFTIPGWYHIYFQIHFRSNISIKSSYKAHLLKASGKREDETKDVLEMEESVVCSHNHRNSTSRKKLEKMHPHLQNHSCVVLKGSKMFEIEKPTLVRMEIKMPEEASIDTLMSRSYLGAMYLRPTKTM
uniref:uncharacterized protein LOC120335902 n=1 Tax=Styela clava TaxID=7725 RepID=UPI00193A8448|nr:uncharacterized protein LOC120335902 [Styela clava]